jgi:hypothetical protein
MVRDFQPSMNRLAVHVDPGRPDAWRKPPYHAEPQAMATRIAEAGGYLLAACGAHFTMMLARQQFPLRRVVPSEKIVFGKVAGPTGWVYDVHVNPNGPDKPAAAALRPVL